MKLGVIVLIIIIIIIEWRLYRLSSKYRDGTILNSFYILYYLFQVVLSCIIYIIDNEFILANSRSMNSINIGTSILPYCIGSLLSIIGIFMSIIIGNKIIKNRNNVSWNIKIASLFVHYSSRSISIYLLVGFIISILISFIQSYLISAISLTFAFTPLLIGIMWRDIEHSHKIMWTLALFIGLLVHTVQGSRGYALFPILALAVGYVFSISHNHRLLKKTLKKYLIVACIFLPFLSFVQTYREHVGRKQEITIETITNMFSYVGKSSNLSNDDGIYGSLGRLLNHTNNVVVVMSPSIIPYRGFDYIADEFFSIFSVLGEQGSENFRKSRADIGYSTGVATLYGFNVDESTSVEFSLFADAYSRFGYIGVVSYSFLFGLLLLLMEKSCYNYRYRNELLSLILSTFFIYNGALSYMYSYYSFFKVILIRGLLVAALAYIMSIFCKKKS